MSYLKGEPRGNWRRQHFFKNLGHPVYRCCDYLWSSMIGVRSRGQTNSPERMEMESAETPALQISASEGKNTWAVRFWNLTWLCRIKYLYLGHSTKRLKRHFTKIISFNIECIVTEMFLADHIDFALRLVQSSCCQQLCTLCSLFFSLSLFYFFFFL